MSVAYSLVFFLSTLYFTTSFSFYGFSFYGWVVAFLFLLPLLQGVKLKSLLIVIIPIISILSIFLSNGHELDSRIFNVKLNGVLLITFGAFYFFTTSNMSAKINATKVYKIIGYVMVFHIFVALVQFVSWYVFSIDLDISNYFGGDGHRAFYYGVYRITGVFDEPAIYSTFILSFIYLSHYLKGKNDLLNYIGVCTVFMSLSFAGIIIALIFLLISEGMRKKIIFILIMLSLIMISIIIIFPEIIDSILVRMDTLQSGNDGSTNLKYQFISFWLENEQRILFGNGMVGYYDGKPKFFESSFDLTFIMTTFTTFGVLFSVPMLFILYYLLLKGRGKKRNLLLLLLSLKITTVIFPYFWVLSGIIFTYERAKDNS